MAAQPEKTTAATAMKKPLSLNERHTLLLSSSRSKPPPPSTSNFFSLGEEDDLPMESSLQVGRRFGKIPSPVEDDFPNFSGVADFNSPPVALNPSEIENESYETSDSTVEISDHTKANVSDRGADKHSEIADIGIPTGNETLGKVKIQGRRRLCKVVSTSNDYQSTVTAEEEVGESAVLDLSDFNSPPTGKVMKNDGGGGGNEIRDILGELSARFDLLSVDKKRIPKHSEHKAIPVQEDIGEYASAGSSFSKSSNSSGSSSDASKGIVVNKEAYGELSEAATDHFAGRKDMHNTKKVESKPAASHREYAVKKEAYGELREAVTDHFASRKDMHNTKKVESKPATSHREYAVKKDAYGELSEAVTDPFAGMKDMHNTKEESKPAATSHRPYVASVSNGEDSEDDCVIVETENLPRAKKMGSHLLKGKYDDSRVADRFNIDDFKGADSEDEHVITLKGPRSTYTLSGKIGKMLYPHQREGLKWLWSLHCQGKGGILGDDMGLGKTMQICGFLAGLFHSRQIKRAVIVAPKTLIPHWIKELGVVGLSHRTRDFFGTSTRTREYELQYVLQDGGIILTTYDIVRNNFKQLCRSYPLGDDSDEDEPIWDYMILDEGHLIKNPSTQRAQSLLAIPCAHRIVISGTPIQNNLKELWALFHFCCPDLLGDKKWFKEKYENPILRGNDKKATERDKRIGSTVAKELREHIQPYFLRRMKSEVFNEKSETENVKLSKKNELIVWLRLTSVQRRLYEAFLNSELVLSSFDGSPLAAITILKKICDHPYLLTKRAADEVLEGMDSTLQGEDRDLAAKLAKHVAEFSEEDGFQEEHDNVSCKISFILSILANLIPQGHNVLIFSQTRKMLNHIQESLTSNGFKYQRIDGTTKPCDRLSIVNDFQEGRGAPIFLLTSQVGGLGLTLTKADRVIVVDPAWNPSMDSQSVDRAYRIGQTKDVLVYRLMTCGTIEEKIYRMQIFKGGLFKTATEQKEQTRYFSKQDLKELFSLPKDGFDVSPTQQQLYEEHCHQVILSDSLKTHLKFLDSLGIGGVSHHSLLYSKTEPTPVLQDEEELVRVKETLIMRHTHSYHAPKLHDDGAGFANFAFNPRDVRAQPYENKPSKDNVGKMTEPQIMERINRLSHLLSNKATIGRLPDSGSKIRKQIEDLNLELKNIRKAKNSEVIDLDDDITDTFNTALKI